MALEVDKGFNMADALTDPDAFDWARCPSRRQAMRLVGIEPTYLHAHISLHTYECICGAAAVAEVSNN